MLLASLVLLLVTFPVIKAAHKPPLRPSHIESSARGDEDSHLGAAARLVSAGNALPSKVCRASSTLLRPVLERHLLGDQLSLPTCWKWHPPASHWTRLPPPQSHCPHLGSVPFAISLRPQNVSPTKAGLGHFCLPLSPLPGVGVGKGDPLEETGRG